MAELIREFLTFYQMEHTLAVFVPEMSMHAGFEKSRADLARSCNLTGRNIPDDTEKPLLLQMLEKARAEPNTQTRGSPQQSDQISDSPG